MAEKYPRAREHGSRTNRAKKARSSSLEGQIETLILNCVEAIEKGEVRVTIADLIRLRKLRDELSPRKTVVPEVTWIDGWEQQVRRPEKIPQDPGE
jgi:acetylglutamate kinase